MRSAKPFFIAALPALFAGRSTILPDDGGASSACEAAAAAERLRVAMINPTAAALGALIADDLSYGHSFAADTNDAGKPGKVALKILCILCIWQNQGGAWKLLARQAVRIWHFPKAWHFPPNNNFAFAASSIGGPARS